MESDGDIDKDLCEPPSFQQTLESPQKSSHEPVVWWIVTFIRLIRTLHKLPDRAVTWLIKFLCVLLHYLGRRCERVARIADGLPQTLYLLNRYSLEQSAAANIVHYVVCRECDALYHYPECIDKVGTTVNSKLCSKVIFKRRCNAPLLKQVVTSSGSKKLYPFKTYSYYSVVKGLRKLLERPGIPELITEHSKRVGKHQVLSDITDGKIWKEFEVIDGKPYFDNPNNYGLMLNCDWFQPFKHFQYSVGVIYFVLLNLPRAIRFKRENVILAAVIPGPAEPSLTINSYLDPIVNDLNKLWKGIEVGGKTIHAALIAVGCDLPAARKIAGFLSYNANKGCSRCYCEFSRGFGNNDYSGFNRSLWLPRSNEQHRENVAELQAIHTKTNRAKKESELGCRYSSLLKLTYFDPVRMVLIDPMHNLFLGTAKHMIHNVYIKQGLLDKKAIDIIHERIEMVILPPNLGRMPTQIDSRATFTAEQWKNWSIYFSIFCLRGLLSDSQMECWRHFVLACRYLCKKKLTEADITIADSLLLRFCSRTERLHGPNVITPNMHMHGHLSECIRDYGPLHAFWLFSFERYNGLLGAQPNNNRSIEMQLIKRFIDDNENLELLSSAKNVDHAEVFYDVVAGRAQEFLSVVGEDDHLEPPICVPAPKSTLGQLAVEEVEALRLVYSKMYGHISICADHTMLTTFKKFSYVSWYGKQITSVCFKGSHHVPYVYANYNSEDEPLDLRPAKVIFYMQHHIILDSSNPPQPHVFAVVCWPQIHPSRGQIGKPVEVWCKDLYEPDINKRFLPLSKIHSRLAIAHETVLMEKVLVTIPLVED